MQSYVILIDEDVDTDEDMALVKGHLMSTRDAWGIVFKTETFYAMVLYRDFVRNGGKLAAMN